MPAREFDLVFDLLDRQIIDCNGENAGKVDDLELEFPADGSAPYVCAFHSGTGALAGRITPKFGTWLESVARRLSESENPNTVSFGIVTVSFGIVKSVGTHIDVVVPRVGLPGNRLEQWTSRNIISRIPGAQHEAE